MIFISNGKHIIIALARFCKGYLAKEGTMDSNKPFLSVSEVAKLLGVSPGRAYQLLSSQAIPCIRLSPRRIRVPRAALEQWIAMQTEKALASTGNEETR
jgi:excisionase family DNA binding protein